jgi:hypothetical protein
MVPAVPSPSESCVTSGVLLLSAKREQKSEVSNMYQNSVDIMGFLGADVETKQTRDGIPFHRPFARHQTVLERPPG